MNFRIHSGFPLQSLHFLATKNLIPKVCYHATFGISFFVEQKSCKGFPLQSGLANATNR